MNEEATEREHGLGRGVAVFSSLTMVSRVLGLIRDIVWKEFFPLPILGSFIFAWRIPNTFRNLVAEGAANAAYVPVFSEYFATKDREEVKRLIGAVTTVTVSVLAVVTIVGIVAAPVLGTLVRGLQHVSDGEGPAQDILRLQIRLTRLVFPYLFLIGVTALGMGLLTALRSFAAPAFGPVLLNVSIIAACFFLRDRFDPPVMSLVVGVLVGGAAQALLQFAALARKGIYPRFGFALSHPGLRMMGLLFLPTMLGQAVGQVNLLVDSIFADSLGPERVSNLYYANRLLQLPLGVFGVAVSTVVLASMSRYAARGEMGKLIETLGRGLRMVCFIIVPAAVGLAVLREPIIRLLFQHGDHFDEAATADVAYALLFYLIGMVSFASVKTVVSAFYSMKETRIPVLCASISMAANVGLNFLLIRPLQIGGLALATTLSFTLNLVLLLTILRRRLGPLGMTYIGQSVTKVAVAASVMGLAVWTVLRWTAEVTSSASFVGRTIQVAAPLFVGLVVFLALARLLRAPELKEFLTALRRGGRSAPDTL